MLLTLLGGSMVTSVFMANFAWVMLGVNWLLEGWSRREGGPGQSLWRERWQMAKESRLLQAFVALYLLLIVGMLWTADLRHGMEVLQVKLPLLVVPLVLLTSRPVTGRARRVVIGAYIGTVLVVSLIGVVRLLTIPDLPYRDAVPYISHIRFALNCCVVVYLLVAGEWWIEGDGRGRKWRTLRRILSALVVLWMLCFLVLLHSYTGLAILMVVALVVMLFYYRRWLPIMLWCLVVGSVTFLVCRDVKDYYRMIPLATAPLPQYTAAGNPYLHVNDGIIENGNYVYNYICDQEMRAEWSRRSAVPFDTLTASGYSVHANLIRYLNAIGATKDSVGVAMLTPAQIAAVERGVANPVYESHDPLRKMVYTLLLEREFYVHTQAVRGFTMLQRLELWKATWDVTVHHPWFGVGTGDVLGAMDRRLAASGSELAGKGMHSHNQYLALLAALGVVGMALVVVLFVRPLCRRRGALKAAFTPFMLAWLVTVVISMLTEDTLDTLMGILVSTYFLAFRPCTNTTRSTTE